MRTRTVAILKLPRRCGGIHPGCLRAFAGLLGLNPLIGDINCPITKKLIEKSVQLLYSATLFVVLKALAVYYFM